MSESGDYDPGPWTGHDFSTARVKYDSHVGRSYSQAVSSRKKTEDLVPPFIETNSPTPLVIVVDQTGSMGDWPATMFSKLPYLEHEAKDYLGAATEISFAAIGDANNGEDYPLQCRPFDKGPALATRLSELVIEGKGGGDTHETYELAALYYARNVRAPNMRTTSDTTHHTDRFSMLDSMVRPKAPRGMIIFIGDEEPYASVRPEVAKRYGHIDLPGDIDVETIFEELKQKFSVYAVLKPYNGSWEKRTTLDNRIYNKWCDLIGKEHIALLSHPERVVDVIFGLLAEERGRFSDYMKEIEERQSDDKTKIDIVYKSLSTVHDFNKPTTVEPAVAGGSTLHISLDDDSEGDDLA